jgi:hypothetical protein
MGDNTISARVEINEYANRVLAVIKAKFGLKDKSEAINKFVELYGDEIVERQANESYVREVMEIANVHLKKYKNKAMSLQELDSLCGT